MRTTAASLTLLLALVTALAGDPAAQPATLHGEVRDAESGVGLPLANVVVEGTAIGAGTDASGLYTLTGVPAGEVVLVASYVGYRSERRRLLLESGERAQVDFALQPRGFEADEVVVEAATLAGDVREVGFLQIPIALVRRIPSAIEDDLFRSLQLLPGVKPASDFSSRLYIRGGTPDQTLVLLDRTPVYNPTHFFGFFSTFNIDAIDDARLWKGAYPVRFGGRLGSVIKVGSRPGRRDRVGGRASLGLLASRASVDGPLRLGSAAGGFALAARRSTVEPLLAALRETEEFVPDGFYFYDANARVDVDLGPGRRLTATAYSGVDDVRFPFADEARFDLRYGNTTGGLSYTHTFDHRLSAGVRLGASHYANYPVAEVAGTSFRRENTLTDFLAEVDADWAAASAVSLRGGVRAGSLALQLDDFFDGRRIFQNRTRSGYGSAFAEATWRTRAWRLTAGLRAEYFADGGFLRPGPRLGIERQIGDRVILQAAYGRYHQFLSLISNEAFAGFDVWVAAAEGVPPSYGDQLAVGVRSRPIATIGFDVELYYRTLRQLFELDPRIQDPAGVDYPALFRSGEGYATGVEVLLERRAGAVTGFLAYTFGITQRRFVGGEGEPFNPDPQTGEAQFYSPKHDRRHDVAMVADLDVGRGWSLTSSFVYMTGQAFTRVTGHYEVQTLPGTSQGAVVTSGFNRARLDPYHRLDFGVTRTAGFFGIGEYELRVQVINLYSRRNLWFYWLDQRENPIELRPARQLPILPNVSLTVDF